MDHPQETRIWHTKRPLVIGLGIILVLLLLGLSINRKAGSITEENGIIPVDPSNRIEEDIVEEEVETPAPKTALVLSIGEEGILGGATITPKKVVEDSRCPQDVQCIQAGRVVVSLDVNGDLIDIEEGDQREVEGITIMLVEVVPGAISTDPIEEGEYRFTFGLLE